MNYGAKHSVLSLSKCMTKFVMLAFCLFLIWAPAATAALTCSELFRSQNLTSIQAAEQFLAPYEARFEIQNIMQSEPFLTYLKQRNPLATTSLELKNSLVAYLQQTFDGYRGDRLNSMQKASLQQAIEKHGFHSTNIDPRLALRDLSKKNLTNFLSGKHYIPEKQMEKVEQLVSQLELSFVHNGNFGEEKPTTPLLSSRQLSKIGVGGGLNSYNNFNSKFLASDDNLFFFVNFRNSKKEEKARASQYGKGALAVETSYANDVGWISAFIMYPHELVSVGRLLRIPEFELRVSKLSNFPKEYFGYGIMKEDPQLADQIRKQLFQFDFTVSDFQSLIRTQLLIRLQYLRNQDPGKFQDALILLESGEPANLNNLIHDLVFEPLGLPTKFELKIPVAIPSQHVRLLPTVNNP